MSQRQLTNRLLLFVLVTFTISMVIGFIYIDLANILLNFVMLLIGLACVSYLLERF